MRVIDERLKVDTPGGPAWHRYSDDGYGEHADGSPFDGTGIGRAWPLLTGERAHYELAAGRRGSGEILCAWSPSRMRPACCPSKSGTHPIFRSAGCILGKPSGSAMPLVWAHAEYVKLRRSLQNGRVFDMPHHAAERYLDKKTVSAHVAGAFRQPCRSVPAGKLLRVEVMAPALVRWSSDGWKTAHDAPRDTGRGHPPDRPTHQGLANRNGDRLHFLLAQGPLGGAHFRVTVEHPDKERRGTRPTPRRKHAGRASI